MAENELLIQEAITEAVEAAVSPQLELLDVPASTLATVAKRRAGRPPGSTSRRREETAKVLIDRFGDARLPQLAVATMPIAELVALGMTPGEALDRQRLAFTAVAPYLFQRMPIAVNMTSQKMVHLTLDLGPRTDGTAPSPEIVGFVVNQSLSEDGPGDV